MPLGRACEQTKLPLLGHRTAHGVSKEAATPEQELLRELEIGARIVRQDICCPIWADGDDGKTVTFNATRSLGDLGVACTGAAAPRRACCTPSGSSRVARCPTVQQRPNPAPDHFQDRLIVKAMGAEWCYYSPDLTPPDFFL